MNLLSQILSSRVRAEIFRLLFSGTEQELHVREIQRRSRFNDRSIRQELAKLDGWELVLKRRSGNRLYYRANADHPLFSDIKSMVLKTSGLTDELKSRLSDRRIVLAFIFGSFARGEDKAHSDIDLFIVGDMKMGDLSESLAGATERTGREINPHFFSVDEVRKRAAAKEHFMTGVLESPKIWLVGTEDELKAVVG